MEKKQENLKVNKPNKNMKATVLHKTEKVEEKKSEIKTVPNAQPLETLPTETKAIDKDTNKFSQKIAKKEEAVALGISLPISKKHGMYLGTFIKNKTIDAALADLEQVLKFKRAVPFKGEIPHRKGNMMSGRYPINATKAFITILKGLRGNVIVNGLELEKTRIYHASTSWASRPQKKGGARFKRANVFLKAKEIK